MDKAYEYKLEQAMLAQRNGDIKSYAMLTSEAEEIKEKITSLQNSKET